jgi:hypothetical protein
LIGEQLPAYFPEALYFSSHLTAATTSIPPNYHISSPVRCPDPWDATAPAECDESMAGFKSKHPGGLNMALGDGSITFINETIAYRTWVLLGNRSDGYSVQAP